MYHFDDAMNRPDPHVERSLALHSAVAAKLRAEPALLETARKKLHEWIALGGSSAPLWLRWAEILSKPLEGVLAFLVERSEEADWLRKASPFSGLLTPQERWRILREAGLRSGKRT